VARLIEAGVAPARIMLVTFTNRAAREMLSRVEGLLGADVRRVWGGTFHSLANRLLRRHAVSLGYENNFSILDSEDAKDLIDACIEEAAIDTRARRFPKGEVLQDLFSFATNTDTPLEQVIPTKTPQFEPLTAQIVRLDRLYQARKLDRNAMDYDDLLINWKRLLVEKPDIAAIYQEQFEHILVDEYQDTNKLQAEIVDLLAEKQRNLMVVGDDAQSIFAWRGANFANLFEFKDRYPDAQIFRLETNYRSTPEILMLGQRLGGAQPAAIHETPCKRQAKPQFHARARCRCAMPSSRRLLWPRVFWNCATKACRLMRWRCSIVRITTRWNCNSN
jgi:DNA helicase-2/ATP-dependent DNA helicase PcrA